MRDRKVWVWGIGGLMATLVAVGLGSQFLAPPTGPAEVRSGADALIPTPPRAGEAGMGSVPVEPSHLEPGGLMAQHGSFVVSEKTPGLCDPEVAAGIEPIIRGVSPGGEVVVDRVGWDRGTLQFRVALASWVSKCLFDGGALQIIGNSGENLAGYDPINGFSAHRG